MWKIAIVDDQKLFLEGFGKILETVEDFNVAATFNNAADLFKFCEFNRIDAVLMDICMEGKNSGIEAAKELKRRFPQVKVINMTGFAELSFIQKAKEAGADSFVYKDASSEEFIECVRRTLRGESIYPNLSTTITFGFTQVPLMPKELEVLKYVCRGMSYQEIAETMHISINTVKYHIKNMLSKTGHKSIVGLAVEAANKGLADEFYKSC